MSNTKEFIGGKFPKPVKAALKERADAAGLTMVEYMERVFVSHLDQDGDEMLSKDEFRQLLQEELAALQPQESIAPPEVIEEEIPEAIEPEAIDPEELEEEPEPIIAGNIPHFLSIAELGGLPAILPRLLSEELNGAILRAWEEVGEQGEDLLVVAFLETLADELQLRAESPTQYFSQNPYEDVLPEEVATVLDPILIDAINEVGPNPEKERLFSLLYDLLHTQADQLYIDARSIEFSFDRSEYAHLDKLLQKVNNNRDSDEQLADLASFIRYQLGEALEQAGNGGLFSAGLPQLVKLGEKFKEIALNKAKA